MSTLLDRRLYRMVRLRAALANCTNGEFTRDDVETRMRAYDEILMEWNDGLNGHLAVIGTYFGEKARAFLDDEIYPSFAASGACLEQAYRELAHGTADTDRELRTRMSQRPGVLGRVLHDESSSRWQCRS